MNKKVLKTLEYDKILELVAHYADSPLGKAKLSALIPMDKESDIRAAQEETTAALNRIYHHGPLTFSGLFDIRPVLLPLDKGASLSAGELLRVASLLELSRAATLYNEKEETPDCLSGRFAGLITNDALAKEIRRIILSEDEIADDASSTLKSIRRQIHGMGTKIKDQLQKIASSSSDKLQDSFVTMRGGRFCLPVKAEFKSSFSGMIHDQSATGSTLFIEPMSVVSLNNDLAALELKEKEEIARILMNLSGSCQMISEELSGNVLLLAELDMIFAKAKYSKDIHGTMPTFTGHIHIKKGRHPLIKKEQVVPLDILLGQNYRLLVITGPNTGGKTVSLKTVGLFTLMGQAGFHVPAMDGTTLRIFNEVYADIGDEQSIEQSLSTFSSHMTNTVSILKRANRNTLVLFDELGAGTDPVEGAALAISILDFLRNKKVVTMATTHYTELKVYALSTPGVENASLEFDLKTLQPTYRLQIGIPGKSNAFAISGKLGLPPEILEDAKTRVDSDSQSFEDVVTSLEENRKKIENEHAKIAAYREQLEREKKNLEKKRSRTDESRDKILARANEEAADILTKAKEMADDSIRQFNKWSKEGATKEMEHRRQALGQALKDTETRSSRVSSPAKDSEVVDPSQIKIGDLVFISSMNMKGTVSSLPDHKGRLFVQAGPFRSQVPVSDVKLLTAEMHQQAIEKRREEGRQRTTRSQLSALKMQKSYHISASLNIIGKTVDEALPLVDKYLDDAYLAKLHQVTIIHGMGTGALKNAVHNLCKKSKIVSSFRLGEFGEGGYGVTVVELKQ